MSVQEIAEKLVALCNEGRSEEAVQELYADDVISIEGADTPDMPARMEGVAAVRQKNQWWFANHDVHAIVASGPFIGHRDDQFAVQFDIDVTPTGGERYRMTEVALYTVRGGKIVQEEFLYQV